jgi:hypothetical protein
VNVPGSLVSFNSDSGRLLTVDYQRVKHPNISREDCWKKYGYDADFESHDPDSYDETSLGLCTQLKRAFKLVSVSRASASLLTTSPIEENVYLSSVLVGDDRVFASVSKGYWYVSADNSDSEWNGSRLMVVGGMEDGTIEVAFATGKDVANTSPVAVDGRRAILSSYGLNAIGVLDATDLDALSFEQKGELGFYVQSVEVSGDKALCSLGEFGLSVINLGE